MEIWDLYDENRTLTGLTHKRGDKIPANCFHLVVHIWIKNKQNQYLITKRAENRESYPLMFEAVGGSVLAGETSEEAAIREVQEEVGLTFAKGKGKLIKSEVRKEYNGKPFNDILDVWLFEYSGEIDLKKATTDEVAEANWLLIDEIKEIESKKLLVPSYEYIFEVDKKLQKSKEKLKKIMKNKQKSKYNSEKSKYFAYYDDIKHSSHKVIDW